MKSLTVAFVCLTIGVGCQSAQLKRATVTQARSVSDLYTEQILANIAMHHANPVNLPYFSLPQTGQNTVQYSLTLAYNPSWDFITSASAYVGRYLLDKQSSTLTGADTNIEVWTTAPTIVPDRLLLMKYAYEVASGSAEHFKDVADVLDYSYKKNGIPRLKNENKRASLKEQLASKEISQETYDKQIAVLDLEDRVSQNSLSQFTPQYSTMLHAGWYGVGSRHDVPKNACHVGHYGKLYVWVLPENQEALSEFTIVILNLATYQAPDRESRTVVPTTSGRAVP